jgi:hypothetical protein
VRNTNIANLLKSGPDAASPLDGQRWWPKVKRLDTLWVGKYPRSASKNDKDGEYNFIGCAINRAGYCNTWPTPILFNGEGGSTCSGHESRTKCQSTAAEHGLPLLSRGRLRRRDRLSWDPGVVSGDRARVRRRGTKSSAVASTSRTTRPA